jgi:phosphonate transport system substrate-binding protein
MNPPKRSGFFILFTRKDSPVNRLSDLKGHIVAFEEPFSSSSYFFPKIRIAMEGLRIAPKSSAVEASAIDEIGYLFSNDDENSMVWLLKGKVDAAAMSNRSLKKLAGNNINNLKILGETFEIPRHVVNVQSDLPPNRIAGIKKVLLDMDKSDEGRKVLESFENTSRFDEIPDAVLAYLSSHQEFIDQEIFHLKPRP